MPLTITPIYNNQFIPTYSISFLSAADMFQDSQWMSEPQIVPNPIWTIFSSDTGKTIYFSDTGNICSVDTLEKMMILGPRKDGQEQ